MTDTDLVKQAWQTSAANPVLPDLEAVRIGADRVYRRIRRRNAIEYVACIFVIIGFSGYVLVLPSLAARIGAAMIVLATFIVAWQLHRRASAVPPPERAAAEPILIHQRAQLARQRDALAGIFTWYLLPFIPGLLVIIFARALEQGATGLFDVPRSMWVALIVALIAFAGVWLLNRRHARGLQKQIDDIDALTGRNE